MDRNEVRSPLPFWFGKLPIRITEAQTVRMRDWEIEPFRDGMKRAMNDPALTVDFHAEDGTCSIYSANTKHTDPTCDEK